MASNCCGLCMYGKNEEKFTDQSKIECMIRGYQERYKNDCCDSFQRDYNKKIVVKSIHNVQKGSD